MDLQQTAIFENLKAAIVATDCAGSIVYWNPFAEVLYGWLPEEVLGRDTTEIALNSTTYEEANAPMAVVRSGQTPSKSVQKCTTQQVSETSFGRAGQRLRPYRPRGWLNFHHDSVSGALVKDEVISWFLCAASLNTCLGVIKGDRQLKPS
jgi:PAS domain-containing protein